MCTILDTCLQAEAVSRVMAVAASTAGFERYVGYFVP